MISNFPIQLLLPVHISTYRIKTWRTCSQRLRKVRVCLLLINLKIITLLTILPLAGCGLMQYAPPKANDPESAHIRFLGPASPGLFVREGFSVMMLDADACFIGKRAGSFGTLFGTTGEVITRVPAGRPARFALSYLANNFGTSSRCSFILEFDPVSGKEYEANLSINGKLCNASLQQIDKFNSKIAVAIRKPCDR